MSATSNGYRAAAHKNGFRAFWKCSGDCPSSVKYGHCKEHSKTGFKNKTLAKKYAKEQHDLYKVQSWADSNKVAPTVAEAAERWLASRHGVRDSTRAQNTSYVNGLILPHLGTKRLNQITTAVLKKWITVLVDSGKAPATIDKAHRNLFQLLENAADDGLVLRDQLPKRLPRQQLPKVELKKVQPFTLDELMMTADVIDPRYRIVVILGGLAGLRISEITGLQPKHLVQRIGEPSVLHIVHQLDRRTGKLAPTKTKASERRVPISRLVEQELLQHLKLNPVSTLGTIVTAPGNGKSVPGPMHYSNFRKRVWVPAMRAMAELNPGFQYRAIHDLRHTYASLLATNGENSKVIAAHLGHTSTRVTDDLYSHLMDDGLGNSGAHTIDRMADSLISADPAVNAKLGIMQGAIVNGEIVVEGFDPASWTPAPDVTPSQLNIVLDPDRLTVSRGH